MRIATTHTTVKAKIPTTGAELLRTPTNMPGHYSYTFMAQSTHTTIAFEEIVATNSTILLCNFTLQEVEGRYVAGFQGQHADDEVAGAGNSYTAEFWQYDSRLGRRWNVDPITYPWQSSYAVFNNCPLVFIDPLGLSGEGTNDPPKEGDKHLRTDKNGNKFEYEYKNGKWEGTGGTGTFDEAIINGGKSGKSGIFSRIWGGIKGIGARIGEAAKHVGAFVAGAANAWSSNQLMGAHRRNPSDFGDYEWAAKTGQRLGDMFAITTGAAEVVGGFLVGTGGVVISATGFGAIVGAPAAGIGITATGHGLLTIHTAWDALTKVEDNADNAHSHKEKGGSSDDGKIGSNSSKMDDKQIAEYFGDKNWHKTSVKTKLMKKFAKQLKGSTNADLYIDKSTGEVLLKGNKNSAWVRTGDFLK